MRRQRRALFYRRCSTLRDARQAYSAEVAESWLDVQLTDLVAFCGVSKDGFADVVVPLIAVISTTSDT